jgi:hypothetical protein
MATNNAITEEIKHNLFRLMYLLHSGDSIDAIIQSLERATLKDRREDSQITKSYLEALSWAIDSPTDTDFKAIAGQNFHHSNEDIRLYFFHYRKMILRLLPDMK